MTGDAKREALRMEERWKNKIAEIMKDKKDRERQAGMLMNVATRCGSHGTIIPIHRPTGP